MDVAAKNLVAMSYILLSRIGYIIPKL